MLCSDDINKLINEIIAGLTNSNNNSNSNTQNQSTGKSGTQGLTPSQLLILGGILANVLTVQSVLIANDQHIEIVLVGSLKRKTELDRMLDKIGSMSFDDVLNAVLNRAQS